MHRRGKGMAGRSSGIISAGTMQTGLLKGQPDWFAAGDTDILREGSLSALGINNRGEVEMTARGCTPVTGVTCI